MRRRPLRPPLAPAAWLVALVLAVAALAAPPAARAEPVFPPGGAIGLSAVPPGLALARTYTGFEDPARGTSILFVEMPAAAYPEVTGRLTREALAAQGIVEKARRAFPVGGREGLLVEGWQRAPGGGGGGGGALVSKWLVFVRGEGFTGLVNASVAGHPPPEEARRAVEAALAALALRAPDRAARRAALPFAFEETPRLRFWESLAGSTAVLAPEGAAPGDDRAPRVVIALSLGTPPIPEVRRVEVAERVLRGTRGMAGLTLDPPRRAALAGLPAVETRAAGPGEDGVAVRVVQWIAFPPEGGTLRVVAQSLAEEYDALAPEFRAVAASLRRR